MRWREKEIEIEIEIERGRDRDREREDLRDCSKKILLVETRWKWKVKPWSLSNRFRATFSFRGFEERTTKTKLTLD
jgi:hypothetical protein